MVDGGVDVYLSGEVHDQTVHERDGILQVSHGSLFYRGEASYVVGQATADQLVLENHQFRGEIGFEDRLWTTSRQGAPGHISYPDASIVTGTLEASRTPSGGLRVDDAAGVLKPAGLTLAPLARRSPSGRSGFGSGGGARRTLVG